MSEAAMNIRTVQRQLAALLPDARVAQLGSNGVELISPATDAPRLIGATVLEGGRLRARRVLAPATVAFRAFLDGAQRSERVTFVDSVPVIMGHAAAVIRERRNRRMQTWGHPLAEVRVYVPRSLVRAATWDAIASVAGAMLVDTSATVADLGAHPYALRDAAIHQVQAHREDLERRLAERWCASERDPLFVDGGISGSDTVARSGCAIGVIKSHMTLYAEGDALAVVLNLAAHERTSVFRATSRKRTSVASWYLRMRAPAGDDPLSGLVRVEIAQPAPEAIDRIGERADEVSSWLLAERSPLALPDAQWDKMVYGIRDCEQYLRSVS